MSVQLTKTAIFRRDRTLAPKSVIQISSASNSTMRRWKFVQKQKNIPVSFHLKWKQQKDQIHQRLLFDQCITSCKACIHSPHYKWTGSKIIHWYSNSGLRLSRDKNLLKHHNTESIHFYMRKFMESSIS